MIVASKQRAGTRREGVRRAARVALLALCASGTSLSSQIRPQPPQPPDQPAAQTTNQTTAQPAPVPLELDTPSVPLASPATPQPPAAVLDTPTVGPSGDRSALSSPVPPQRTRPQIGVGSAISMQLSSDVSSGSQRNGETVRGVLKAPVKLSNGAVVPPGANVDATVVSSARAGTITSAGVLSLQLTRVGDYAVITDVADFNGQEGHKDVPDSAPAKGTEAVVKAGTVLQFHVLENGKATGLEPGAKAPAQPPSKH